MGLSIGIGMLADLQEHDPEGAAWLAAAFEKLNVLLVKQGLPRHEEPSEFTRQIPDPSRRPCTSFPYGYLHRLRRALAIARQEPSAFSPVPDDWDPSLDPWLEQELFVYMDAHLICHSDCEGFYVPVDFAQPLYGEKAGDVRGGIVGSSQYLLQELIEVAPLLGIRLEAGGLSDAEAEVLTNEDSSSHPYGIERLVWFALYEAASASLAQGVAIVFH